MYPNLNPGREYRPNGYYDQTEVSLLYNVNLRLGDWCLLSVPIGVESPTTEIRKGGSFRLGEDAYLKQRVPLKLPLSNRRRLYPLPTKVREPSGNGRSLQSFMNRVEGFPVPHETSRKLLPSSCGPIGTVKNGVSNRFHHSPLFYLLSCSIFSP